MIFAMLVHEDAKDALAHATMKLPLAPPGSKEERVLRATRRTHTILVTVCILLAVVVTASKMTHGVSDLCLKTNAV